MRTLPLTSFDKRVQSRDECGLVPFYSPSTPSEEPTRHTFPHFPQCFPWDCGLACVQMMLQRLGIHVKSLALRQHVNTTSIWTIDLAHLLQIYNVQHVFYTRIIGINPSLQSEQFYAQSLTKDTDRITKLTAHALRIGLAITQERVTDTCLQWKLMTQTSLFIILVNKNTLYAQEDEAYVGHYICAFDYNPESCRFLIKDPALNAQTQYIPANQLHKARSMHGTDDDMLEIPL